MNKQKLRSQRAITLIALIITIIILLILAVVTIGTIQESNVITYAQNAANDYNKEKEKEESTISGYESLIDKYLPAVSKIEYYINEDPNTVQKVDRMNGIATVYTISNGSYLKVAENSFEEGELTTESIEINVMNHNDKTTNPYTLSAGAVPLIVNNSVSGYFHENKLYGNSDGEYSVFDLVTDKSKISEIESKIANIE